MNYLKQINAFIDWLETNPLEASTQTLWFHLMGIANKSGWPEWFTVANLTLQAKVGVTENTLNKHRNYLVQRARIDYRSQGKQKAGRYRIIPFTSDFTSNIEANHEAKREVSGAVNHEANGAVNGAALFKQNEIKRNEIENVRDQLLGLVNSLSLKGVGAFGLDTIYSYISVVEVGVIEMALKKSDGRHLNYFVEVINGWIKEGRTTLELVNPIPAAGNPPPPRQSQFGRHSAKPKLPVVEDRGPASEISSEEREKMRELARKLKDG